MLPFSRPLKYNIDSNLVCWGGEANLSHAELPDFGGRHELQGRLEHQSNGDVLYPILQEPHLEMEKQNRTTPMKERNTSWRD